jgi:hypothetical protein
MHAEDDPADPVYHSLAYYAALNPKTSRRDRRAFVAIAARR